MPPTPPGGPRASRGIKLVLMGVAARMAGRPVKWIEDRLEHLTASVSATNRVVRLEGAVGEDGRILALAIMDTVMGRLQDYVLWSLKSVEHTIDLLVK